MIKYSNNYTNYSQRLLCMLLLAIVSCPLGLWGGEREGYIPKGYSTLLRERIASRNEVRILHIGDSHLSGGFMTSPIERALRGLSSRCLIERIGVPGATFASILKSDKMERLKTFAPDLIIVSLGTNDSYTMRFSIQMMRANIKQFISFVDSKLDAKPLIVFTTPPLSYIKQRVHRRASHTKSGKRRARYMTSYSFNTSTLRASDIILSIAAEEGCAAYDLTRSMQTKSSAEASASHYLSQGWLHTDRVHYTRDGYTRLGDYIARWLTELLVSPTKAFAVVSPSDSTTLD